MSRYYLVPTAFGVILTDERGEVVASTISASSAEKGKAVEYMKKIEAGELAEEDFRLLSEKLSEGDSLVVEDEDLARFLAKTLKVNVSTAPGSGVFKEIRRRMSEIVAKLAGIEVEQYYDRLREASIEVTRSKVKEVAEKRDLFIAQAIRALDDVNKTINLFASRVREWYGLHFPELDELVEDHEDYLKIVSRIGDRRNITPEALRKLGFEDELARKIISAASTGMGADLTDFDLNAIRLVSDVGLQLYSIRRDLEKYIDEAMYEVAPNVRGLVGPLLGARLIALAGGLSKLATLPASTIQVLGAEKALFRALRYGAKPPKHGVIFQHSLIHKSPKWQRGKIARALAAKLAIAARIDAFTGEYRADELREDLEKRVEEIRALYPTPPPKKARAEEKEKMRRRGKRR
ncbi:MAG: C/D box methylation guide ribonucleoprotein complex aNOP56 subunit [Thermofilum sp.]|uniref:C/D box methylation guide ribonucleoprotein complex aNOP56 subunit n=1 Tax=Thermofilum pendens TaxID=2269 RepID=A0A7C4GZY7_THEPE